MHAEYVNSVSCVPCVTPGRRCVLLIMQATIAVVLVVCGIFSHGRVHAASVGKPFYCTQDSLISTVYAVILIHTGVFDYRIPIPNLFNGSTDNGIGCTPTGEGSLDCFDFNMNTHRLVDGDNGPLHSLSSTNLHRFLAWNRTQTQPVTLRFGFDPQNQVSSLSSVVLYFFNYPTQRIGLPSVTLRGSFSATGTPFLISFVYNSNNVLNNNDSQLRNVSLSITSNTGNIQLLFIDFVFTNTDIDWILLSEVDICEGMHKKVV